MPLALKIFGMTLFAGVSGGYVGFRVAWYLAMRYGDGDYKEAIALLVGIAGCAAVGIASAVTTGVMMGKRARNP